MEGKGLVAAVVGIAVVVILIGSLVPLYDLQSDSETLDVFIIDGQSNAAYLNETGSVDLDVVNSTLGTPDHDLYYYGNSTRPTMFSDSDTDYQIRSIYSSGEYVVGGLVAPFAYYLSESQGRDILVLDVGISAQSITNLVPGSTGGDWKVDVIADALDAVSGYDHINMIGWTWLQGESDTSMAVSTYKSYFLDLEDYYKSIGCPNCYIVKTRDAYGGNATIAQTQLIASNAYIHLGTDMTEEFTGTDYMIDNLHYTQAARILIAEAVSEVIPVKSYGDWDSVNPLMAAIPMVLIIAVLLVAVSFVRSRE